MGPMTGHGIAYWLYLIPFWRDFLYNPDAIMLLTYLSRCHSLLAFALPTIMSAFDKTSSKEARSSCSTCEETMLEKRAASMSFRLSSGDPPYLGSGYDASAFDMNCVACSMLQALK